MTRDWSGPFDNPGSTAGYFTLMIMVCAVELIFARGRRRLLVQALILLNLVGMVATGNRAGFLIMVAMFPVLLLTFKKELGARRVTQYLVGGVAVLAVASAAAISYTGFGRMFERLGAGHRDRERRPDDAHADLADRHREDQAASLGG